MNLIDKAIQHIKHIKEEYKENHLGYEGTSFLSIQEDNHLLCSIDPNILEMGKQCILVHKSSTVDFYTGHPNYTFSYHVEFINDNGEILKECLDNEFRLYALCYAYSRSNMLYLTSEGCCYTCCPSWGNTASIKKCFQSVWILYNELKNAETPKEKATIVELYKKDETILQQKKEIANISYTNALLEKERDMYKGLLDDIKGLLLK